MWTFLGAARMHAHGAHQRGPLAYHHDHAHVHEGDATHVHAHGGHPHAVTAVGVVHGLAGSGAAVALIPVVALESPAAGIGYLVVFAAGTILAMALYGVVAGFVVGRASQVSLTLARTVARVTGIATVIIGAIWLLG
jgi:sulfite exporter TauE/SafE